MGRIKPIVGTILYLIWNNELCILLLWVIKRVNTETFKTFSGVNKKETADAAIWHFPVRGESLGCYGQEVEGMQTLHEEHFLGCFGYPRTYERYLYWINLQSFENLKVERASEGVSLLCTNFCSAFFK